jgi:hypothetical protein
MMKRSFLAIAMGAALLGLTSSAGAGTVDSWDFKAYGGFAQLHVGDFPNPGYHVLLTPLPPEHHQDMGAFYWSEMAKPSLLSINQKGQLSGKNWKAPGRYYGEENPIQPGITTIHGDEIVEISTNDPKGQVIGWAAHFNNLVPVDFKDARVAVNYHLQLFEPGVEAPVWDSGEMFFFIDVWETENRPTAEEENCCPDGNLVDTGRNESGCADRFRVGVLEDNYPAGDPGGDGVIDIKDLENAPDPGACFDALVDSFTYDKVDYEIYLTGFWEAGDPEPVGEGWSPEYDITHFEVRAEVWEADAASDRDAVKCAANPNLTSCDQPDTG